MAVCPPPMVAELYVGGMTVFFGGGAYHIKVALFALYHSRKGASILIPFGFGIVEAGRTNERVSLVELYWLI